MGTTPENLEPTPAPAPPAGGGSRAITPVQIALVAGLVVVLLAMVWFFFLRSPAEDTAAPPAAPAAPAPTPEPTETVQPGDEPPVENFDLFAPRDPFEPLVTAGGAGGGGTSTDGTTDGTGDGTTDGTGDGTTDGTGDGTTDGTGGSTDGGEDVGGHRVRVIDVFREGGRDRAQIQVDGTVYTVDEGEDFADNFRLVNASGRCATMLFGDDEFTLCEGEEILK